MPETQAIVFVVDDDASVREALERLIRSAGLRVEAFASAEEFLKRRALMHRAVWCWMCDCPI